MDKPYKPKPLAPKPSWLPPYLPRVPGPSYADYWETEEDEGVTLDEALELLDEATEPE